VRLARAATALTAALVAAAILNLEPAGRCVCSVPGCTVAQRARVTAGAECVLRAPARSRTRQRVRAVTRDGQQASLPAACRPAAAPAHACALPRLAHSGGRGGFDALLVAAQAVRAARGGLVSDGGGAGACTNHAAPPRLPAAAARSAHDGAGLTRPTYRRVQPRGELQCGQHGVGAAPAASRPPPRLRRCGCARYARVMALHCTAVLLCVAVPCQQHSSQCCAHRHRRAPAHSAFKRPTAHEG
jgi:hypothetical protein